MLIGLVLKRGTYGMTNDYDIILTAVKQNGYALEYVSFVLQSNFEITLSAVKQNNIAYAAQTLKYNKEIVKTVFLQNPLALQYTNMKFDIIGTYYDRGQYDKLAPSYI